MSKSKIVLDLRQIPLTDEQIKDLNTALHKTVVSQLKKNATAAEAPVLKAVKKAAPARPELAAAPATKAAVISVTFLNGTTNSLRATLRGQTQELKKSGSLTFSGVKSGDIILISGDSLGTTTVTIDISADPASLSFGAGHFDSNFFIN